MSSDDHLRKSQPGGQLAFGAAIKELRAELGFQSQQAFAQHLGVSIRSVAGWEAGRIPKSRTLSKLRRLALESHRSDVYCSLLNADLEDGEIPTGTTLQNLAVIAPASDAEARILVLIYEIVRNPRLSEEKAELLALLEKASRKLGGGFFVIEELAERLERMMQLSSVNWVEPIE
jgi:transcriptional regulator with XRE-family HTH domain